VAVDQRYACGNFLPMLSSLYHFLKHSGKHETVESVSENWTFTINMIQLHQFTTFNKLLLLERDPIRFSIEYRYGKSF